jgi:hypothetical protein
MHDFLKELPGLKASEIGKTVTGRGVAEQGPIFYRVTVEQCGLDRDAIQRQAGLEMMVGNAAIASVLGPNEDIAKILSKHVVFVGMQDFMTLPLCACLSIGEGEG